MKTKPILLSLVTLGVTSYLTLTVFSQNSLAQADKTKSSITKDTYSQEVTTLKSEAKRVISEYNTTAENVKYTAIKNNKNLESNVKKLLVELETRVTKLEDKLDNMKYQSDESWIKFRDELNSDIKSIKNGIKELSAS